MVVSKKGNAQGIILIIALVVICSYFITQETGITGAVIGIEESVVDHQVVNELNNNEEVPVIIELKENSETNSLNLEEKKLAIKEKQANVLEDLNTEKTKGLIFDEEKDFTLDKKYSTINAISGNVTKEGLKKLKKDSQVKKISYDYPIKVLLSGSIPVTKVDQVWDYSINNITIDGTGETVCVIDTGIDYTHPALGNCTQESFLSGTCSKVIGGYDYGDDDNNPKDAHSHGTHVSGIVASEDSTYRGVAPGAKIVALKVFTDSGYGTTSNALSAIDWCVNNATKFNISVITMSIGVTDDWGNEIPYLNTCDNQDALAAKASWAASQGIFVDVSSGNSQGSAGITSPACGENVTSVGSTTKSDGISGYNTAPILSILAPGSAITSTVLNNGFSSKSGTSMAAPHVAGGAVLLIQYWKLAYGITLTPAQVKDKLRLTGKLINDTRNGILFPRINLLAAIQPIINFAEDNLGDEITQLETSALINITSDVNLATAILEWKHPNGSSLNYTMESNSNTNFYYIITQLKAGNHTYFVYGQDSANTLGESATRTLEITQSVPTAITHNPLNQSYHNQIFNLNISIAGDDLVLSNYSITNSSGSIFQTNSIDLTNLTNHTWSDLVNLSEGEYLLTVYVGASLTSTIKTANFVVDKTSPILSDIILSPNTVYDNDSLTFYVNVTDTNRNNSAVLIEGNWNSSQVNYSMELINGKQFSLSISADKFEALENVTYQFYASDLATNLKTSDLFNFTVQESGSDESQENNTSQNNEISSVNITLPLNETVLELGNSTQFTSTATDPDNDTLTFDWNFGDSTNSNLQNPTKTFNSTGTFTTILNVSDGQGNSKSDSINVVINDTLAPIITSITYDEAIYTETENNQSVTATVLDYSGVSEVNLYYNNTIQTPTCTNSNTIWSCSWFWNTGSANAQGNESFFIQVIDNFEIKHSENKTYSYSVITCGDGLVGGDEDCDGTNLNGQSCATQDYDTGTLACSESCSFDYNECSDIIEDDSSSAESSSSASSSAAGGGASEATTTKPVAVKTPTKITSATIAKPSLPKPTPVPKPISLTATLPVLEDTFATTLSTTNNTGIIEINKKKIAVSQIILKTIKDLKDIKIDINYLNKKPAEVSNLSEVYQYLDIKVGLKEEELTESLITFKVPAKWLKDNNYTRVSLNTYSDGKWQELKTTLLSNDSYQAKVTHFSYFAITGGQKRGTFALVGLAIGDYVDIVWKLKDQAVVVGLGVAAIAIITTSLLLIRRRSKRGEENISEPIQEQVIDGDKTEPLEEENKLNQDI